jgi:hypothetical protein
MVYPSGAIGASLAIFLLMHPRLDTVKSEPGRWQLSGEGVTRTVRLD